MIKTFTENDLIRLLYDELTENESKRLEQAIVTENNLQCRLNDLRSVINDLDQVKLSPLQSSVDKILNFSKRYHKESVSR